MKHDDYGIRIESSQHPVPVSVMLLHIGIYKNHKTDNKMLMANKLHQLGLKCSLFTLRQHLHSPQTYPSVEQNHYDNDTVHENNQGKTNKMELLQSQAPIERNCIDLQLHNCSQS